MTVKSMAVAAQDGETTLLHRGRRRASAPAAVEPWSGLGQQREDAVDQLRRHLAQGQVVVAGVAAQALEPRIRVDPVAAGQETLGLLDDDPGVQRLLQLGDALLGALRWPGG